MKCDKSINQDSSRCSKLKQTEMRIPIVDFTPRLLYNVSGIHVKFELGTYLLF